jgi:hypothetical protein
MKYWAGIAVALIGAQFVSIFVIQPIGAVPDGRTVVITRPTNVNFVDSTDAICARKMGGVSILCRAAVLGRVAKESTMLVRLPYSDIL